MMTHRALALLVLFAASLAASPAWAAPRPTPRPGDLERPNGASPYAQPPPGSPPAPVPVATSDHPPRRRGHSGERWPVYTVLSLSGGKAFPDGVSDAWYGRAELGAMVFEKRGSSGPKLTLSPLSLEGWSGGDGTARGGAIPVTAHLGYGTPVVHVSAGVGLNLLTVDRVAGRTGYGGLSPVAAGNLGLSLGSVLLQADVRAQYRWQFAADDLRIYTAGLSLGFILDDH
jgi:hypothetical protein